MRSLAALGTLILSFALVAPAYAGDNGEGLMGETDDRMVTFFALGVLIFFTLTVILLSALQGLLERRKEERKAAELRRRIGW